MRVQFFATCLVDTFYPETRLAAIKLLEHFGVEVIEPPGQTCCGKPADSAGHTREVKKAAEHFLAVMGDCSDPLVIPSGSCASMVKNHFPALFQNDTRLGPRARALASRTFELSQFLVQILKAHEAGLTGTGRITYHASCQLIRELGVRQEPLMLINSLRGAEFVPLIPAERCCGFGGVFMATMPEISQALADEKLQAILASGADTVTGADHGCLMNIADAVRRNGAKVRVRHIAAVLAEGLK